VSIVYSVISSTSSSDITATIEAAISASTYVIPGYTQVVAETVTSATNTDAYYFTSNLDTDDSLRAVSNDNFVPTIPILVDNGNIFAFGKNAAIQFLKNPTNGDLYVSDLAFPALRDTLTSNSSRRTNFTKTFDKLCSGEIDLVSGIAPPIGCAMLG
jgi:hypothetical protein